MRSNIKAVKAPFLSISDMVTLKYSHERKRRDPKYMSRDRWKFILNVNNKREFTKRKQVCAGNYFHAQLRYSVPEPIARTDGINYRPFHLQ